MILLLVIICVQFICKKVREYNNISVFGFMEFLLTDNRIRQIIGKKIDINSVWVMGFG